MDEGVPQRSSLQRQLVTADSTQAMKDLVIVAELFGWALRGVSVLVNETGKRYRVEFER